MRALILAPLLVASACATPDHFARDASPSVRPGVPKEAEGAGRGPDSRRAEAGAAPVVVELFSSEGCSSCPPADRVLRELVEAQPVAGARVIGLELHVDYWNYLGWTDPFSSNAYSARQERYSKRQGKRGAYTPQMIVDGQKELIGSNDDAAKSAILAASRLPKAKVQVTKSGDDLEITVDTSALGAGKEPLDVLVAVTEQGLATDVPRGENSGETLRHGPVVRSLTKVGATSEAHSVIKASLALAGIAHRERSRAVVFVQRGDSGAIVGAEDTAL